MSDYTPGPWHITRTARGHRKTIRCERRLPNAIEGIAVANIVHACGFDEERANAQLIAAAPELLEACKVALAYISTACRSTEIESLISEAIAKAEGKAGA